MRLKFLRPYYITLNFFRLAHKRVSFLKKVCRYECMLQYVILKSRKILAADCNWFQYNRGCARAIYFPSGFCLYVIRFVYIHRIYASFDRSKARIVNTLREKLQSVFGHAARAFLNTMQPSDNLVSCSSSSPLLFTIHIGLLQEDVGGFWSIKVFHKLAQN